MDGQNFNNEENTQFTSETTASETQTTDYYQDYTTYNVQYQNPVYTVQPQTQDSSSNAMAIVSLILGILSIVTAWCYGIGIIFGIIGLILAIVSRKKNKSGVGIAGLVCSIIGIVFSVFMIVCIVIVVAAIMQDPTLYSQYFEYYY